MSGGEHTAIMKNQVKQLRRHAAAHFFYHLDQSANNDCACGPGCERNTRWLRQSSRKPCSKRMRQGGRGRDSIFSGSGGKAPIFAGKRPRCSMRWRAAVPNRVNGPLRSPGTGSSVRPPWCTTWKRCARRHRSPCMAQRRMPGLDCPVAVVPSSVLRALKRA